MEVNPVEKRQKKNKTEIVIVILAVLLGVNVTVLTGTLIYNYFLKNQPASVVIQENIISPLIKKSGLDVEPLNMKSDGLDRDLTSPLKNENRNGTRNNNMSAGPTGLNNTGSTSIDRMAEELSLYDHNPDDNMPFMISNMFPGDRETKYYCIRVSHEDDVTVCFHADVRNGYEKLAEVMKCQIVLLSTGETLYDGKMRDMPDSINHTLKTDEKTTSELYYEITVYLDTSVGNEYMEKDFIADFKWWVPETESLKPSPQTGDNFKLVLWVCLAAGSLFILILLAKKRRKEDEQYEQ